MNFVRGKSRREVFFSSLRDYGLCTMLLGKQESLLHRDVFLPLKHNYVVRLIALLLTVVQ